jgi:hypothetical protein
MNCSCISPNNRFNLKRTTHLMYICDAHKQKYLSLFIWGRTYLMHILFTSWPSLYVVFIEEFSDHTHISEFRTEVWAILKFWNLGTDNTHTFKVRKENNSLQCKTEKIKTSFLSKGKNLCYHSIPMLAQITLLFLLHSKHLCYHSIPILFTVILSQFFFYSSTLHSFFPNNCNCFYNIGWSL